MEEEVIIKKDTRSKIKVYELKLKAARAICRSAGMLENCNDCRNIIFLSHNVDYIFSRTKPFQKYVKIFESPSELRFYIKIAFSEHGFKCECNFKS